MIINNENVATEVDENVDELATEELVDGGSTPIEEQIDNNSAENNKNELSNKEEEIIDEQPKMYTEKDVQKMINAKVDEILPRKIERQKAKIERAYQEKYSKAEQMLKFGFNAENLEEATEKMQSFFESKGYKIPNQQQPNLSEEDLDYLAEKEANKIIDYGFDEIVEETDRLSQKGVEGMTQREKKIFMKLAQKRQQLESEKELASLGINSDALKNKDYQEFSKYLDKSMSEKDKYLTYLKYKPQVEGEIEQIGSMKTNAQPKTKYKDIYTPQEVQQLSEKDLDDPQIMAAVERSMAEWYKNREQ